MEKYICKEEFVYISNNKTHNIDESEEFEEVKKVYRGNGCTCQFSYINIVSGEKDLILSKKVFEKHFEPVK
jgi:hypothetical protein